MLHTLTIKGFAVHAERTINFEDGLTAITGPNGIGKSLVVEAIRYALFGTGALRGVHPTGVTLDFSVKGERYRVNRNARDARLQDAAGTVLSVGTKPTNLKIIGIFGYGLEVFDVANCANQGLIEALSNMRPADRKRMVETTVGMDTLEKLVTFTRAEANTAKREAEALARGLGPEPSVPLVPADPREEPAIRLSLTTNQANHARYTSAKASLTTSVAAPTIARPLYLGVTSEQRENAKLYDVAARKADAAQRQVSGGNVSQAAPHWDEETQAGLEAYWNALQAVSRHTQPTTTSEALDAAEAVLSDADDYARWKALHGKGHYECPSCQHQWPVEADALKRHQDWQDKPVPAPTMTRQEVAKQRGILANWKTVEVEWTKAATVVMLGQMHNPVVQAKTPIGPKEFAASTKERERQATHNFWLSELATHDAALVAHRADKAAVEAADKSTDDCIRWDRLNEAWLAWEAKAVGWRVDVRDFQGADERAATDQAALLDRVSYSRAAVAWVAETTRRAGVEAEITSARDLATSWQDGAEAINEVRQQIEGTIVPGLAALSSVLVQRMTGGARERVEIDPGFALKLDGQEIETLSGSEKAAVNLALRIALGRMLTSRVFSVLILDEPDAAMDDARAATTAECLRSLCPEIAQVILVTHKTIGTDQVVVLN